MAVLPSKEHFVFNRFPGWLADLVIAIVLFARHSFGLDPSISITQYHQRSWKLEQGLPQISVNAIAQTPDGYLWIGTDDGLARFDGISFTIFNHASVQEISNNSFQALLSTPDGVLWAATSSGLIRYQNGKFKTFGSKDGLQHTYISSLAIDARGVLWLGTIGGGLIRYDQGRFVQYLTADGLANDEVWAVAATADGSIWAGTREGLSRFTGGRFSRYLKSNGLSDDWVRALCSDGQGGLWIGTDRGLNRYDGHPGALFTAVSGVKDLAVQSLRVDRKGAVWVGTRHAGQGLSFLRAASGQHASYKCIAARAERGA